MMGPILDDAKKLAKKELTELLRILIQTHLIPRLSNYPPFHDVKEGIRKSPSNDLENLPQDLISQLLLVAKKYIEDPHNRLNRNEKAFLNLFITLCDGLMTELRKVEFANKMQDIGNILNSIIRISRNSQFQVFFAEQVTQATSENTTRIQKNPVCPLIHHLEDLYSEAREVMSDRKGGGGSLAAAAASVGHFSSSKDSRPDDLKELKQEFSEILKHLRNAEVVKKVYQISNPRTIFCDLEELTKGNTSGQEIGYLIGLLQAELKHSKSVKDIQILAKRLQTKIVPQTVLFSDLSDLNSVHYDIPGLEDFLRKLEQFLFLRSTKL